jgi:copper resistance protein B
MKGLPLLMARSGLLVVSTALAQAPAEPAAQDDSHSMPYREMVRVMQMDDTAAVGKVLLDQLEWRGGGPGNGRAAWDVQAWYGGDYNKLRVKSEGKYLWSGNEHGVYDADAEVLWDRVVSRWWNIQAGARQDFGSGPARTWAAVGLLGLSPQWFETDATFYIGDAGRTAVRLKAQYDLLLTQRLVLQPFVEANFYGRADPRRQIGSGLSDLELSARLRYEIRRELAPYLGFVWLRRFGGTAAAVRAAGADGQDLEVVLGLHVWF